MAHIGAALVALLQDDGATMKTELGRAAEKVPEQARPQIRRLASFLGITNQLHKSFTRMSTADNNFGLIAEIPRAGLLLSQIQKAGRLPNPEPLALPVPTVSLFYRRVSEFLGAYLDMAPKVKLNMVRPAGLTRLNKLIDDFPDAALLLMSAYVHVGMATDPINTGDVPHALKLLAQAAELSWRATTAPNVLPRSSISYLACCLGLAADLALLKLGPQTEPSLHRVRAHLHLLIADGERWPKLRREFIPIYVKLTIVPLLRRHCTQWRLEGNAGREAFAQRRQHLASLARALLDDWAISEPRNALIPQLRNDIARWQDSSGFVEDMKASRKNK